jgi:deoxyribose-phosphate aldolase
LKRPSKKPINPGIELDPSWIQFGAPEQRPSARPERSQRSAATRSELLLCVSCLDLTSLRGDENEETVLALCALAREPLPGLVRSADEPGLRCASVCLDRKWVGLAARELKGTGVTASAAVGGFPEASGSLDTRVEEISQAIFAGADEVDVPIRRDLAIAERWEELDREVREFRKASAGRLLKVILSATELASNSTLKKAALVALMAGADFLKTSTGKENAPATLAHGAIIAAAIREFSARTGCLVGFKASGGIRVSDQALAWLALIEAELGERWLQPSLFRLGASELLSALANELAADGPTMNLFRGPG